jgi:hypothetical protein
MVKPTYANGDVWCKECNVWIFKEDIAKFTHPNKIGGLNHNVCNWRVRRKPRMGPNKRLKHLIRHKPQSMFKKGEFAKSDIKQNKEKLEKWIVESK